MNKIIRRSTSIISGKVVTAEGLWAEASKPRTIILGIWLMLSILIMNVLNVYAYARMPVQEPLPDIISRSWPSFAFLRASPIFMRFQPADMVSCILSATTVLLLITNWYSVNMKKLVIIYCFSLHIRTLLFSITAIPPPCGGFPNCPCSVVSFKELYSRYGILTLALKYTISAGMFNTDVPQCGDLTMSGHTIYIWVLALHVLDCTREFFTQKEHTILSVILQSVLIVVSSTIVFLRNHYSLDVILAIIIVKMLWWLYSAGQILLRTNHTPFVNSSIGHIFKWLEDEPLTEIKAEP